MMCKWIAVCLFCIAPGIAESGTTGKIMGNVTEKSSKQALPGINFLLRLGSGFPYTPTSSSSALMVGSGQATGPLNSSRGPWSYQMDVKASKVMQIGRLRLNAYLWGLNILNKRNTTTVYAATGNADTTGWLNTNDGREYLKRFGEEGRDKYRVKEANPMLSGQPRQIRLGLACGF